MINVTEAMMSSGQPIAQGEVLIWMKKYAPQSVLNGLAGLKLSEMKLEGGRLILGHSETGHHHVMEPVNKAIPISAAAQALIDTAMDTFIELRLHESCELIHMRPGDTHEGYTLPPGEYIRGIREEQTIEGWRQSRD